MSQIPYKQSMRIEMTGWFKHYFPGNLRNFLFTVCNYTSYQNLQNTSLPNPFAREKAGDKAGTCLLQVLVTGIVTNRKQKIPQITGKIMFKPTGHFCSYRLFTENL